MDKSNSFDFIMRVHVAKTFLWHVSHLYQIIYVHLDVSTCISV